MKMPKLVAQWVLMHPEEEDLIVMRRSENQEPVADNTYKGLVMAKSRAIGKLSRDMADTINKTLAKDR